ncbi:MAG: hypothetical protein C0518_14720 [Opitutus sp.]|nr:hypothetical protein [Opitutus sp.]
MIASLRRSVEKIAFGAALLCTLGTATWNWRQRPALEALRREPAAVELQGTDYVRADLPMPAAGAKGWPKPRSQSHGPGWIYEVFTPPVIYYHEAARSFAVTPPAHFGETVLVFGLELLDVKRELYRLQLVGYVGAPGDYVAAFVSPKLTETLLARSGKRFEELGLALASIDVRKINVSDDPGMPAYDIAAIATLRDEQTGTEVTLDSRARKFTDTPLAVLRLGAGLKPREVREGDVIEEESATYRIERIQLDPPEVVVAKQVAGLPYPETRVLKPIAGEKLTKKSPAVAPRFQSRRQSEVAASESHP